MSRHLSYINEFNLSLSLMSKLVSLVINTVSTFIEFVCPCPCSVLLFDAEGFFHQVC